MAVGEFYPWDHTFSDGYGYKRKENYMTNYPLVWVDPNLLDMIKNNRTTNKEDAYQNVANSLYNVHQQMNVIDINEHAVILNSVGMMTNVMELILAYNPGLTIYDLVNLIKEYWGQR